ncbi:MAG: hypothetical protein QOE62_2039 [Actinomycetota bacterium]|jgi:ribosome-associated toxin RatA of RatAB toxin-antitoxin module|nr:hypothetical protein [Actinomycetota bacterium]
MNKGTIGKATIGIDASPEELYDLVSDVRRMGEWSPECQRCIWLDGATGPAVGARFKGSNAHGKARWSTKTKVVVADPGREFAFVTGHLRRDMTKWSYRFEPTANGTTVTESFEMLANMPWYFALGDRFLMGVKDRRADLEENMAETLQRLKSASERRGASA